MELPKKSGKSAYDKLQIKLASQEIEAKLLAEVRAEINAEYPVTEEEFDINDKMYHLELNKLATPILKYRKPVPTPRRKNNSVVKNRTPLPTP